MKLPQFKKPGESSLALKGGSYSIALTAIVLALLVVLNIFACALPATATKLDISSSKLYSITSNTKVVLNSLEEDVTIYWIVQADKEDDVLENLLAKYESLSDHIEVVKRNPDVYPTFASQYTDEAVANNSLVVECGERSRYIGYDDIYLSEVDMSSYSMYSSSFDGEGAITSAIDYVTSDELPQLYLLEGHGESELPASFSEQLEKDNIETQSFSLLNVDAVPEDADAVLIYAPSSDISEEESDMLADYVAAGGKLLVICGPKSDGAELENLYSVIGHYGVTPVDGVVVEGDREYYAFQSPAAIMPEMVSSDVTDALIEESYHPIIYIARGLEISDSAASSGVTALLTSSDSSFSKLAGYDMETYEKEEGDIDGPFALAVSIEPGSGGRIIWFSSDTFLDDIYNAYSSGANLDLVMNSISSLIGESEAMGIRSKSLNYNYLTISDSASSMLKALMIGVFPIAYLACGIYMAVSRRRVRNAEN